MKIKKKKTNLVIHKYKMPITYRSKNIICFEEEKTCLFTRYIKLIELNFIRKLKLNIYFKIF